MYDLKLLKAGINPPDDINVVIEIPKGSNIKYEIDVMTNILYVDRILSVDMVYPCNYGFIPKTLEYLDPDNDDNLDVFILGIDSLIPGSMVNCIPLGIFLTEDQDGLDSKIVAQPNFVNTKNIKNCNYDTYTNNKNNIDSDIIKKLQYFIEHHKDLEIGKFVKTKGFQGKEEAKKIISHGIKNYTKKY